LKATNNLKEDSIFIVVNAPDHWYGIGYKNENIQVFDSVKKGKKSYNENIKKVKKILDFGKRKYGNDFTVMDVPQQNDRVSCGVFLCYFCECFLQNKKIDNNFQQQSYREKILQYFNNLNK